MFEQSDGVSWAPGSGGFAFQTLAPQFQQIDGDQITYQLDHDPEETYFLFETNEVNTHARFASARFYSVGSWLLQATAGSTTGTITGWFELASSEDYGKSNFVPLSSGIGDWVPFNETIELTDTTFSANTFNTIFHYTISGAVHFDQAIPEPANLFLLLPVLAGQFLKRRR